MTPKDFSTKLTAALDHQGWSQSDLARAAGLRRDAISTYCRGAAMPLKGSLDKIAKAFGVSAAEMLDGAVSSPTLVVAPALAPAPAPAPTPTPPSPARPTLSALPASAVELKQDANGELRLRLDLTVTLEQAMDILTVLSATRS